MKYKFPFFFVTSVLLIWMGVNNRQLILDRNLLVSWIPFIPALALAYYLITDFLNKTKKENEPETSYKNSSWLVWLMIVTAAMAFTFAVNTLTDSLIIRSAKNTPSKTTVCDITFFRMKVAKSQKRYVRFLFEGKKYRKKISINEARYLGGISDPAQRKIELTTSPGWFGTQVIHQYKFK